ncbi:MAG TPA: cbb3-type cytochrome c oxidase subunit 3 [Pseudomonadales bacterium]
MSAFWGNVAGVVTVVLMLTFIGIWVWAWLPRHKVSFDRMAALPLQERLDPAADRLEPERHR